MSTGMLSWCRPKVGVQKTMIIRRKGEKLRQKKLEVALASTPTTRNLEHPQDSAEEPILASASQRQVRKQAERP